jgi:hypothetical protein
MARYPPPMPVRPAAAAFAAALAFAPLAAPAASVNNPNVPTGEGDAIFAVGEGGVLDPVAVRLHGKFLNPGSNEGQPSDKLRMESNASLSTGGNKVHVIFGGRVIATVPAKVENGAATIAVPPTLHVNQNITALASPTLSAHAKAPRRAPTPSERTAALAAAARSAGVASPSKFEVSNLTAMDLGHGTAFIGTLNVRGTSTPRKDKRIFFIAESQNGALRTTLLNVQSISVTEPLLEEVSEHLVDAIDLGDGTLSVVTRMTGYDAYTYAIYSRKAAGWKNVYTGGGVAA